MSAGGLVLFVLWSIQGERTTVGQSSIGVEGQSLLVEGLLTRKSKGEDHQKGSHTHVHPGQGQAVSTVNNHTPDVGAPSRHAATSHQQDHSKMVFCNKNMAMSMGMSGYTFGVHPEDGCFVFLYKDYVVDTEAKYIGLIFAMLILGIVSELMREAKVVHFQHWFFQSDVWSSVYLAVQMGMSYTLMLLVMLFDFGVVFAACSGLGIGHFLGRKWRRHAAQAKVDENPYEDAENPLLGGKTVVNYTRSLSPTSLNPEFTKGGEGQNGHLRPPDTTPCCRV